MREIVKRFYESQKVLIAEDHDATRELLKKTLSEFFMEVIESINGNDCLEKLQSYDPDIVITDLQMPLCNGIETIEKIRARNKKIPIIIISAYKDDEYLFKAANLDIQGYVLKPLDIDLLEEKLTKIYELHHDLEYKLADGMYYSYENSQINNKGEIINLTFKENEFLNMLILKSDSVVQYDLLEYELWTKYDEIMSYNSLRSLVKKLRTKLPCENLINNVSKQGYKIIIQ